VYTKRVYTKRVYTKRVYTKPSTVFTLITFLKNSLYDIMWKIMLWPKKTKIIK